VYTECAVLNEFVQQKTKYSAISVLILVIIAKQHYLFIYFYHAARHIKTADTHNKNKTER